MRSRRLPHLNLASRWGILFLLGGVALIASLAVACGGDGAPSEEPTLTPVSVDLPDEDERDISDGISGSSPPALTVTVGAESIEAALGSFCYGNICADAIAPITPVDALFAEAGQLIATLASETIAEVSVTAVPSSNLENQTICTSVNDETPTGPICEGGTILIAWTGRSDEVIALGATAAGATIDLDISTLEPGTYVVDFFVRFEGGGDAAYGVLLDLSN